MNERDDEDDRTLDELYRRASEADAGDPSRTTRAAILAEARAQAARRQPAAANEAWYRRPLLASAAASVALAGIALLLWRDGGRDLTAPLAEQREAVVEAARNPADEAAPNAPAPRQETLDRSTALASGAAPAQRAVEEDIAALVEREFPGTRGADATPRGVWLVRDASGRTIRSGTLDAGESFDDVERRLRQEWPDRKLGAFEVRTVTGDDGVMLQVGLATAP